MNEFNTGLEYENTGFGNPIVQVGLDRRVIEIIKKIEGANTVCDLGCGNGRLALQLGALGYRVVGVDSSRSGITLACREVGDRNVQFVCNEVNESLLEKVPMPIGGFDLVVSIDVIEHMYRPRELIEVAAKILRPGGALILCTPYHGYLKNLLIGLFNKWDAHHGVHWDGGHIKFFSVPTLTDLVREYKFQVESFRFFGRAPLLWKNMICIARK
jgi:2-polyprenyl-3-methyl-5-hydroxy-6-metoxy-1,4-benzoquinol methylase